MAKQVISTAQLECSFGAAPAALTVIPATVKVENQPPATIPDMIPMTNIPPFGMCKAPTNPAVIAATAAAAGVFTQAPCVPVPAGPWVPGTPKVLIGFKPALNDSSKCMCSWLGVISVKSAGSSKTEIP